MFVTVIPSRLKSGSAFKLISCTPLMYYILRVFSKTLEIKSRLRVVVSNRTGKIKSKIRSVTLTVIMAKSLSRGKVIKTMIRTVVKDTKRTRSSLDSAKESRTAFLIFWYLCLSVELL